MKTKILILLLFLSGIFLPAISQISLTIEKIMQDPKMWIGISPSGVHWSESGDCLFFNWNPEQDPGDSLYYITTHDLKPRKVSRQKRLKLPSTAGDYNSERTLKAYLKDGNVYLYEINKAKETLAIDLLDDITAVKFSFDNSLLLFQMGNNLFSWEIASGYLRQLTDLRSGKEVKEGNNGISESDQDKWLKADQLSLFEVLSEKNEIREKREMVLESEMPDKPLTIYIGNKRVSNFQLTAEGYFITYSLFERSQGPKDTEVANYITESGYTETINTRTKVGGPLSSQEEWIYNLEKKEVYQVNSQDLPGITDVPDFYADYDKYKNIEAKPREVYTQGPVFSEDGKYGIVIFRSRDNKDRWITLLNLQDGSSKLLDRQRDEAWISGPGIGWSFSTGDIGWMADNKSIWFQSEESGYSHLYMLNVETGKKSALTRGPFEVYNPRLNKAKTKFYFEANVEHPGVRHFYSLSVKGVNPERITSMEGRNDAFLSPDEKWIAILYSYVNKPEELYLMKNAKGEKTIQVTKSTTADFDSYPWKVPEFVTFKARDNADVHARLYRNTNNFSGSPAVIFVHGAGYLQNAHKWWSSYFREYMFHNFLLDNGYVVLDIDYRGSAGYGRDWRTAIYRHMGGWDLNDQVDGAGYLAEEIGVDSTRIGIYGGSYGGFITLMALFTQPDVFAAGAALRSVTDWAHYNHPYTSNILNTPVQDSIAYRRSSPIYYAEGLNKPLLIAHGMADTNVHFQDVVRLAQRLIELGKENWEMAIYPVEDHGFTQPSSWTDEYKRIFKLFETNLK